MTVRTTTTLRNAGGTPHLHTCPQSVIVVLDALYAIWQKYAQGGRGIVARCDCGVEWWECRAEDLWEQADVDHVCRGAGEDFQGGEVAVGEG